MRRYRTEWYAGRIARARESARVILPLVFEIIGPKSVADVGCGTGSWLYVARDLGISDVVGIDADHVDLNLLEIHRDEFLIHDLAGPVDLGRTVDLALCLEVGEHIRPESADTLVATVTGLAPAVLFSAAIPWQGGTAHVNEQWPEYWARKFLEFGYQSFDVIRPLVWCDPRVRYFYAQNAVLYVREAEARGYPALPRDMGGWPLPLVHPRLLERVTGSAPAGCQTLAGSATVARGQRVIQRGRARVRAWWNRG